MSQNERYAVHPKGQRILPITTDVYIHGYREVRLSVGDQRSVTQNPVKAPSRKCFIRRRKAEPPLQPPWSINFPLKSKASPEVRPRHGTIVFPIDLTGHEARTMRRGREVWLCFIFEPEGVAGPGILPGENSRQPRSDL